MKDLIAKLRTTGDRVMSTRGCWQIADALEEQAKEMEQDRALLDEIDRALDDVKYSGSYVQGILVLKAEIETQQARIAELREALEDCLPFMKRMYGPAADRAPAVTFAEGVLATQDDLSALEAVKAQTRRDVLLEAADVVELTSEETSCKRASEKLRRMVGEVK